MTVGWRANAEEWLGKLPASGRVRFVSAFRRGSLEIELYAPRGADHQTPHPRDEVYVVTAGRGTFVAGGVSAGFSTGDVLFVPAGLDHRFENFSDDFAVWVMFYGADGGEDPDGEEAGWSAGVEELLGQIPARGMPSVSAFRHGTLEVKLYAPRGEDTQSPRTRDEIYVVVRGRGQATIASERKAFGPSDILFVPAGVDHRFEDFSDDLALWVMFYGPEGGEGDM
ncbi:MAG: cupin domain-containing protein [Alphaproteobacteria bacterium]